MTAPLSVARLPPRRRRRLGLVVLVVLFALVLLLSNLVPLAAEWLWFQALGYERVFTTRPVAEAVFGVTDPVFGRGVGYSVFTVPGIAGAIGLVIAVTTLTLLATVGLYALRRDIVVFRRQVTVEPSARLHLAGLIALLFVLVALWVYFVRLPGLLYSTTGPLVGASFADLHAQLTGLRLAGLAAVAGGALVLWGVRSQ